LSSPIDKAHHLYNSLLLPHKNMANFCNRVWTSAVARSKELVWHERRTLTPTCICSTTHCLPSTLKSANTSSTNWLEIMDFWRIRWWLCCVMLATFVCSWSRQTI